MASLSCPAADEVLSGVDALSVPLFDEEFALGPPMRLVRSDRVRLFGAGNLAPVTARFITVMIGDSEKRLGVKGLGFSSS